MIILTFENIWLWQFLEINIHSVHTLYHPAKIYTEGVSHFRIDIVSIIYVYVNENMSSP